MLKLFEIMEVEIKMKIIDMVHYAITKVCLKAILKLKIHRKCSAYYECPECGIKSFASNKGILFKYHGNNCIHKKEK